MEHKSLTKLAHICNMVPTEQPGIYLRQSMFTKSVAYEVTGPVIIGDPVHVDGAPFGPSRVGIKAPPGRAGEVFIRRIDPL